MYNAMPAAQVLNTRLAQKNQEIEVQTQSNFMPFTVRFCVVQVLARKVDIQQKVIERGEVRVT